MLVQKLQFLVGREGPQSGRAHRLRRVTRLSDGDHGLQAEYTGQLGLLTRVRGVVDGGEGGLEGTDGGVEVGEGSDIGGFDGGDDVLWVGGGGGGVGRGGRRYSIRQAEDKQNSSQRAK